MSQGTAIRRGIDLAISERNARAGAWAVEHLALDASDGESGDWTAERERANAQLAAADQSAVAYIGPYTSGATAEALPITNRAGLLQLGVSATWPGLTLVGWNEGEPGAHYPTGTRNFARLVPTDSAQGELAARWASALGMRHILVLSDGSTYSDGLAGSCAEHAKEMGMVVSGPVQIKPVELTAPVSVSASSGPDAVFYAASTVRNAGAVIRVFTGRGETPARTHLFLSDTALSDQLFEEDARGFPGLHLVHNGVPSEELGARAQAFYMAFEEKYGTPPGQQAANAYDATNLVLDAVAGRGRDRRAVRDAVLATDGYQGVSGAISFDENGDRSSYTMSGYNVEGGRFVFDRLLAAGP